jgi:hypothetical protein
MLNNPVPILEKLDELRANSPDQITFIYQKFFGMPEGEMILVDLMDHFFEFKPTNTPFEAGEQAVVIYIKNRLLGVTEVPERITPTGDQP